MVLTFNSSVNSDGDSDGNRRWRWWPDGPMKPDKPGKGE